MELTREEALAIASERKAARRVRTSRIRKLVATLAVAAFIGPFAVIYNNIAAGKDPALTSQATVARISTAPTGTTTSSASTQQSAPAAVTTQQS
jgi:hypothetical protein